jgi:hypothetical protein
MVKFLHIFPVLRNAKTRPGDSFRFIVKAASLHAAFMGAFD